MSTALLAPVFDVLYGTGGFSAPRPAAPAPRPPAPAPRVSVPKPAAPKAGTGTTSRPKTGTTSTTTRPRTGSITNSAPRIVNNKQVIVNNHYYSIHSGGWGYGYYNGYHPVIIGWYGYPCYYGNPVHWSGWTWSWAPLIALAMIAAAAWALWAMWRRWGR